MREQQVWAYLKAVCKGRKTNQKGRQLGTALRISGTELRKQGHRLRKKGHPIASSQDGYLYAGAAGEVYSAIGQLRAMEHGLKLAREGLERSLDSFGGDAY